MENLIIIFVLLLIIGGAGWYIYKAKKKGQKCIGCPYAKECSKSGCGCEADEGNEN